MFFHSILHWISIDVNEFYESIETVYFNAMKGNTLFWSCRSSFKTTKFWSRFQPVSKAVDSTSGLEPRSYCILLFFRYNLGCKVRDALTGTLL